MEFEEMKKIWDKQSDEPLYVINEEALHRYIMSKKRRAVRLNNTNDYGLIAICIITAIIYSFIAIKPDTPNIYDYLIVATLLLSTVLVWVWRIRREKKEQTFGRTVLGDLDHAISSVTYEMSRSKHMVLWVVLPLFILIFLNMTQDDASFWKWVVVASAFVLSALVLQWDYNRCQKPKRQKLEALRNKLIEKTETKSLW